ncbi:RNA polymerase II-associated protein 3-like [Chrysoperla carnea]|uniref:RNA polymerase II-associated protein 3-like n=1 Tax=Chrysoperla carnea TaxID=189513 RepID=UPI001D0730C3|nr:RNA polymerase II-associated protein 3-like [Chrysoperla carnea]
MSNSIIFQKQVRDNSTDLHSYVKELSCWEEEMKRKEVSRGDLKDPEDLPPVRSKTIRKSTNSPKTPNRIRATDYSSWDKFDVDAACQEIDEEIKPLSPEELEMKKQRAYVEKENGNKFVKNQNWTEAVKCYTKAIKAYDSDPVFYANRALCYLKLKEFVNAEIDCTNSLRLDSTYVKALQRRAAARIQLTQLNEALKDLTKVMELEPNNRESLSEITKLKAKLKIVDQPKFKTSTTAATNKIETITNSERKIEQPILGVNDKVQQPITEKLETVINQSNKIETLTESVPSIKNTIPEKKMNKIEEKQNIIWDDLNNRILIRPIVKPPHLRSKKPLKRITVEEIDEVTKKEIEVEKSINDIEEIRNEPQTNTVQEINKSIPNNEININTLPLPKTCLQFSTVWKNLGTDLKLKFQYFTKIEYKDLSNLFQEFLESDLFFDILMVLKIFWIN